MNWRKVLLAGSVLAVSVLALSKPVKADDDDPRFTGSAGGSVIGKVQNSSFRYVFDHGGNFFTDSSKITWGGYWSGILDGNFQYRITAFNQVEILPSGFNVNSWHNTVSDHGGGFFDAIGITKIGTQGFTDTIYSPDSNETGDSGHIWSVAANNPDYFFVRFHQNNGRGYETDDNGLFASKSALMFKGIPSPYTITAGNDGKVYPFSGIGRWRDSSGHAIWSSSPLSDIKIDLNPDNGDIPIPHMMNNTTSAVASNSAGSIAPDGYYQMDSSYNGIRKLLSWSSGENNNRWFTAGDSVTLRNISPVLQADNGEQNSGRFNPLTRFMSKQVHKQAVLIDDRLEYKGGAKMYAILRSGEKRDVSDRFDFYFDGSRLVAKAKNIADESDGGYNNAQTVGYSMMVPTTVKSGGQTGSIDIRGASQIFDGTWNWSGNDKINIYVPEKPASSGTSSRAAVFNYQSDNNVNFSYMQNSIFYDNGNANGKMFRAFEQDGYIIDHDTPASPKTPDYILNDRGYGTDWQSDWAWRTTQDMTIAIPYDPTKVTPVGAMVTRIVPNGDYSRMLAGTNGITGQIGTSDGKPAYIVTIPAAMVNAYRTQGAHWQVAMKYVVSLNPGTSQIDSQVVTNDEISGTQRADNITNYLTNAGSVMSFDTLDGCKTLSSFSSGANRQVHLLHDQTAAATYNFWGIGQHGGASNGMGQPLTEGTMTTDVDKDTKVTGVALTRGDEVVYEAKYENGEWTSNNQLATVQLNGTNDYDHSKQVVVTLSDTALKDKNLLYYRDDWKLKVQAATRPASDESDVTDSYDGTNKFWTAKGHARLSSGVTARGGDDSNHPGLYLDGYATLTQPVSRKRPVSYLIKHDAWPGNNSKEMDDAKLTNSSIQAREVFDYRIVQFAGNSSTNTEAYKSGLDLKASISQGVHIAGDVKVKAYDMHGNLADVTGDFKIEQSVQDGKTVVAATRVQNNLTGKYGSYDNRDFILSIPLQNQEDSAQTVRTSMTGGSTVNGQWLSATRGSDDYEYIPPETPYFYGCSATSAQNRFDPKNPEKDQGKIDNLNSEGASSSAQISTAPIQWVLREQLGTMGLSDVRQKYAYDKFSAEFPDAAIFKRIDNQFKVYDETGRDVSASFEATPVGEQGLKIAAKKAFLADMSNYGHQYYFVIDATVQNSHANRLKMAAKTAVGSVYSAFKSVLSGMSALFGHIGIGNTDKSAAIPNLTFQNEQNLLQIDSTPSNINEKVAQLNDQGFDSGVYKVASSKISRSTKGYDVSGVTAQLATDARRYESYRTTFAATGGDEAQQVRADSVKITDSLTGQDVTGQYDLQVSGQNVSITAHQEAIDRMTAEHRSAVNENIADRVSFHVDTWGSRSQDTAVTWLANHNINGYDDARSQEQVIIPQSRAGKTELSVAKAGTNQWQSSDLKLDKASDLVDVRLKVTVPTDLHNQNFTDFITHYIGTEITPAYSMSSMSATIQLGDNDDYRRGTALSLKTTDLTNKQLFDSRALFEIPSDLANQLNTTDAVNAAPTYTIILHNVSYQPKNFTANDATTQNDQYRAFLTKSDQVVIPVGAFTTASDGNASSLNKDYVEGKNGSIVDQSFGTFGSKTDLGWHSGRVNIILGQASALQGSYINGRETNTSYTNKDVDR